MGNLSQRDAFWNKVYELAKDNKEIIIISSDMGAPALDQVRRYIPAQFINVGIAEQNGMGVAAGLALSGKKVFIYAIAPFITLRCLEQIRVNNAIMGIPVTIVGVGAGFGYEDSGPTHHLIEDIAVMRSMPLVIHSVSDAVMSSAVAEMSVTMRESNYVRLDRAVGDDLYKKDADFSTGLAVLKEGRSFIVSTGCMTYMAMEIALNLGRKGQEVGVIDLYRLPVNEDLLVEKLGKARRVITLEEHFLAGGLGSAVCEVMADRGLSVPVKRIGIAISQGYCYTYGGREKIREYYGIDQKSVTGRIEEFLKGV